MPRGLLFDKQSFVYQSLFPAGRSPIGICGGRMTGVVLTPVFRSGGGVTSQRGWTRKHTGRKSGEKGNGNKYMTG